MYKRDIYLDIDDNLNNYIKSVELDSNSRVWHFHLTVDYEPLDLTGKSVQFRAEKPDKTNVLNDCKIVDAEKGVVEVKLTRQVNAIPGHVKCLLKIIGDEGFVLKTKTFVVDVSKTMADDAIVSSDEFGALEAALGKVQDIDNRFAQTNAQLSQISNNKADKSQANDLQQQINSLVIASGNPETSSAELVQSRVNSKGTVFATIKNRLDNIENSIFDYVDRKYTYKWAVGSISQSDFTTVKNLTRICVDEVIYAEEDLYIELTNNVDFKFGIRRFPNYPDASGSVDNGWLSDAELITKGTYFRIQVSKIDGTEHGYLDAVSNPMFDALSIYGDSTLKRILSIDFDTLIKNIDSNKQQLDFLTNSISCYLDKRFEYDYVVGYLGSNGIVDETRKFRISTPEKILVDEDFAFSFNIQDYKYWIHFYDAKTDAFLNTTECSSITKVSRVDMKKGQKFMLTMGRASNNTSEVFDTPYNDVFDGFRIIRTTSDFTTIEENKKRIDSIEERLDSGELTSAINYPDNIVRATAHRGYSLTHPENTMIAYEEAYKKGFRILETDIKFTSDGVAVLLHDQTLNRVARNSDGSELSDTVYITNITYEQANQYDYGIYKGEQFKGTKIATLEQLLLFAKKHNCHVQLDGFASNRIEDIFNLVRKHGMLRYVGWSSFVKADLQKILTLDKKAYVMYLFSGTVTNETVDDASSLLTDFNTVTFAPYVRVLTDYSIINYAHQQGIKVEPYTINQANDIINLVNNGVDGIITDGMNIAEILLDN